MYSLTEEALNNSMMEAFGARISKNCFKYLDAAVEIMGSLDLPAVPINLILEKEMLPMQKTSLKINELLQN
jgi:2-oxoisovalerate dehydrogenase E1 component